MNDIDIQYPPACPGTTSSRPSSPLGRTSTTCSPPTCCSRTHTMGRLATSQLAELATITSEDEVLDAGSGIGGTARFLASQCRCRVTAIDLTEEYCEIARLLNRLTGLDDLISVRQGDVTGLPFADATFEVVISQHVQMNVADKSSLYSEARRVLVSGGRVAIWDIAARAGGLDYPLPWADRPELSHLASPGQLRAASSPRLRGQRLERPHRPGGRADGGGRVPPAGPLGLHAFVRTSPQRPEPRRGPASGQLRAIQGIALAVA